MPSTLCEATLLSSIATGAAAERNPGQAVVYMLSPAPWLGQILSHHLLDQVYQQGSGNSLQMLRWQLQWLRMYLLRVILCRVEALRSAGTTSDDTWVTDNFYAFVYLLTLLFTYLSFGCTLHLRCSIHIQYSSKTQRWYKSDVISWH